MNKEHIKVAKIFLEGLSHTITQMEQVQTQKKAMAIKARQLIHSGAFDEDDAKVLQFIVDDWVGE